MAKAFIDVKKVSATDLRDKLKSYLREAKANRVVLVDNRRQASKYLVDKEFLDSLVKERESILATLEILADRELTDRLLSLSKSIDNDVALAGCLPLQMFLANEPIRSSKRGEMSVMTSRMVGSKLHILGFTTTRLDSAGRGLQLKNEVRKRIHRAAWDYRVAFPSLNETQCDQCREILAQENWGDGGRRVPGDLVPTP